jgi:hypothetical protein
MHQDQARLLAALTAPAPAERAALSLLDEELSRLPEQYRAALVLCYLQGMTNEEAAHWLGCPLGTVLRRMARARQLLRGRLARRGVRTSAAVLVALLAAARARAGSVPTPLAEATVRAGVTFVTGGDDSPPHAGVVRLADSVLRPPRWHLLTVAAFAVALLAAVAAGRRLDRAAADARAVGTAPACHPCGDQQSPGTPDDH